MRHKSNKLAVWISCCLLGYLILTWTTSNIFVWCVGKKYQTKISGIIFPNSIKPGSFRIQNAKIEWRGQFNLLNGTVDVQLKSLAYDFHRFLINLQGNQLKVRLGKDSVRGGGKEIIINRVDATVELLSGEEPVIHSLVIDSPELKIEMRGQSL